MLFCFARSARPTLSTVLVSDFARLKMPRAGRLDPNQHVIVWKCTCASRHVPNQHLIDWECYRPTRQSPNRHLIDWECSRPSRQAPDQHLIVWECFRASRLVWNWCLGLVVVFLNYVLKRPMIFPLFYLLAHEQCSFSICWILVAFNVFGCLSFAKESLIEILVWMGTPGQVGCGRGIAKQW